MYRLVVTIVTLVCFGVGCGVFKSSTSQASFESSSDSSSSCSSSSKDDEKKDALRRDVQTLVATHASRGDDVGILRRDLGALAETHGLTDWERSDDVYVAIGRGLAQAGVGRARAEAVGRDLGRANRQSAGLVVAGYVASAGR
jgi:hypothetical protein